MDKDERFDIDEAEVTRLVRGVVQEALMQVTGRFDAGARPTRVRPVVRPAKAAGPTLEVLGWESIPSTRAELMQRLGYTYENIGRMYRRAGINNSAIEELRRQQARA